MWKIYAFLLAWILNFQGSIVISQLGSLSILFYQVSSQEKITPSQVETMARRVFSNYETMLQILIQACYFLANSIALGKIK